MRKHHQKNPPFVRESAMEQEFDKVLRSYLKSPSSFVKYILESAQEGSIAFDAVNRKPSFLRWFNRMVNEACDSLKDLYIRFNVPPGEILNVLAFHEIRDRLYPPSERAKLRSLEERKAAARNLEGAAEILEEWRYLRFHALDNAVLWSTVYTEKYTYDQDLAIRVRGVAKALRQLGGPIAHRPRKIKEKDSAIDIGTVIYHYAGKFLDRHVGLVLLAAFPSEWNPSGKIEDAVYKLIGPKREKLKSSEAYEGLTNFYTLWNKINSAGILAVFFLCG